MSNIILLTKEKEIHGSYCTCGHVGDKDNSEHEDHYNAGHGRCLKCDCKKFTWKKFAFIKEGN